MTEVQCFWVYETGSSHHSLRRYRSRVYDETDPSVAREAVCPGAPGYHNATASLEGEWAVVRTPEGYIAALDDDSIPHDDPRWPTKCEACDYAFVDDDAWQVNISEAWARNDTGETVGWGLYKLPAGAMWDAKWMPASYHGPDGMALTVQLPDGTAWCVDGPSSESTATERRGWTRTGDPQAIPPTVSATPSILTPAYHGFLTAGKLVSV